MVVRLSRHLSDQASVV